MNWNRITRGEPKVLGVNRKHSGLLNVAIPLSESPPREWASYFERPVGISIRLSMHPPKLHGASVSITPPDEELEAYIKHVDERIEAANASFETQILPRLQAQEERQRKAESDEEQRLRAARERLKK